MTNPADELDAIDSAREQYDQTAAAHDRARAKLVEKVVAALKAGATPTQVARRSRFTDAHIRSIARNADIPAAKPGIKPGKR